MNSHRSPWRASIRIALFTSVVGSALAVAGPAHAQTSAALGELEQHEEPERPPAREPRERIPGPPDPRPREGRAWASLSFVGLTHLQRDPFSSTTVAIGLYGGPYALGIMGAVAEGVLLGGQVEGYVILDDRGWGGGSVRLGPRIEILFGDVETPVFVAADAWLGVISSRGAIGGVATRAQVGGAVSFGVHAFVNREISISPYVQISYARPFELDDHIVQLTLGAQLAGWW